MKTKRPDFRKTTYPFFNLWFYPIWGRTSAIHLGSDQRNPFGVGPAQLIENAGILHLLTSISDVKSTDFKRKWQFQRSIECQSENSIMPRARRFYIPGGVWHITHRCHNKDFLLKFERDRLFWKYWLFQARKRYGLCVLHQIATSNHLHLLVQDIQKNAISKSMQLISGRIAREYNQR